MHRLGFPEDVSEGTPVFIELCARTIITIQLLMSGEVEYDYALWFAFWVSQGAIVGIFVLEPALNTHYKSTLMLGFITLLLISAAIATAVMDSIRIRRELKDSDRSIINFYNYWEVEEHE